MPLIIASLSQASCQMRLLWVSRDVTIGCSEFHKSRPISGLQSYDVWKLKLLSDAFRI